MRIKKVINNNILCVVDDTGGEMIVTGKGLGFKRKIGERVDPALLVGRRVGQFGCEALVKDRAAFARLYPELTVDRVSLEDIMVFTVKGDVQ